MSNLLSVIDQGLLPWETLPDCHEEETKALMTPIAEQITTLLSSQRIKPLQKAHLKATLYWLQTYEPSNSSLEEIVQGYLDAFYHLAPLENWILAYQIFSLRLPILPNYTFYENLGIWGYYREQIKMGEMIIGKISHEVDCLCLMEIGNAYLELADYQKAIDYYQQLLDFATQINNPVALCQAYGGYGKVYRQKHKFDLAIQYFQKQLSLCQNSELISEQVVALVSLIGCYDKNHIGTILKKNQKRLDELLAKLEEFKDPKISAFNYCELGSLFFSLNNHKKAVDYLQKSLGYGNLIYCKVILIRGISFLGIIQAMNLDREQKNEDINKTLVLMQKTVLLIQETGDLCSEMIFLNNLAVVYYWRFKKYEDAVFYLRKALKISEFLDHQVAKSHILAQLAFCHTHTQDNDLYRECIEQALVIARQENSKPVLALALAMQANADWLRGNYLQAIILLLRSLMILPPWQNTNGNLIWQRFLELLKQKIPFLAPIRLGSTP